MPRTLLAYARLIAGCLFVPALALVAWGELGTGTSAWEIRIWDKLLHFIAYFGLAGIATVALSKSLRGIALAGFALVLFGGILEIVQGFVGRDAEWGDESANVVGVFVGTAAALSLLRLLQRRSQEGNDGHVR